MKNINLILGIPIDKCGNTAHELTSDFAYIRFHSQGKGYSRGYPESELKKWTRKIQNWIAEQKDVFAYFSNDKKRYSPKGAMRLMELLGIKLT